MGTENPPVVRRNFLLEIFRTSDAEQAMQFAQESLEGLHGKETLDLFFNQSVFLQTGVLHSSDCETARNLGIPVWQAGHLGGSIVCFPGDLSICLTTWGDTVPDFGKQCMQACIDALRERHIYLTVDGNDVLARHKKVASWAKSHSISGWVQTVAHFSVTVDVDLIRMLCTKPMNKIPGALKDYGITADELWQRISALTGIKE